MNDNSQIPIKMRADAQRNRERLLEAAKKCFAAKGDSATLDDIVSEAGVGIGTLYRHFATREALIEAVYLTEHLQLVQKAKELEAACPPLDAVRAWLLAFLDVLATKRTMQGSLNLLLRSNPGVFATSRGMMGPTFSRLLQNAADTGAIAITVEPMDILRALVGIAQANSESQWQKDACNFVDLLLAGMKANGDAVQKQPPIDNSGRSK